MTVQDVDLTIRYGEMPDVSGVTTSFLTGNHRVICGAPDYLNGMGRPERPADLQAHNCLCLRTATSHIDHWPVGRSQVKVSGDRSSNDGGVLRDWAIRGRGLILKSWWDVREDFAAGRLERVLTQQPPVQHPLRLARPSGRDVPIRVRLLAEHLKANFAELDLVNGSMQQ